MSGLACLKKSQTEDEDAQELKLGPDFSDAQCLSISEVRLVMEAMIYDYNNRNEDASSTNTQVFEKTLKYVQRFEERQSRSRAIDSRHVDETGTDCTRSGGGGVELAPGGLRRGKDARAVFGSGRESERGADSKNAG